MKDPILLGNDFVEAIFGIVVSCFDGSRLDGHLFGRGGVGCLACLVLYFVEAPFMPMTANVKDDMGRHILTYIYLSIHY